jgi:hypothetical protein
MQSDSFSTDRTCKQLVRFLVLLDRTEGLPPFPLGLYKRGYTLPFAPNDVRMVSAAVRMVSAVLEGSEIGANLLDKGRMDLNRL